MPMIRHINFEQMNNFPTITIFATSWNFNEYPIWLNRGNLNTAREATM